MNMILDATPLMYLDANNKVVTIPLEMVLAYVSNPAFYTLDEAAKLADIHDEVEAENLLASITGKASLLSIPYPVDEDADYLAIQPPSLR